MKTLDAYTKELSDKTAKKLKLKPEKTLESWAERHRVGAKALQELKTLFLPEITPDNADSPESRTQKKLRLASQDAGGMLLRNNSGSAMREDKRGVPHPVRFGLGNTSLAVNRRFKSSDLIGITPVKVGPGMLGRDIGVFTAVEVKSTNFTFSENDERLAAQRNFLQTVRLMGGIGIFATTVMEFDMACRTFVERGF